MPNARLVPVSKAGPIQRESDKPTFSPLPIQRLPLNCGIIAIIASERLPPLADALQGGCLTPVPTWFWNFNVEEIGWERAEPGYDARRGSFCRMAGNAAPTDG